MLKIKDSKKEELKKFGFKECKKPYGMLYYRCIARGIQAIFIGAEIYIQDWNDDDPRIHKNANCKYRSNEIAEDILFDLIKADLVEKVL